MAYHSDVCSLIYGTKEQVDLLLTTHFIVGHSKLLEYFANQLSRYTARTYDGDVQEDIIIHVLEIRCEDCKWYEDYVDVKEWMQFLNEAEELGLRYEFVRIGENTGDIEEKCSSNTYGFISITHPAIELDIDSGEMIPIL